LAPVADLSSQVAGGEQLPALRNTPLLLLTAHVHSAFIAHVGGGKTRGEEALDRANSPTLPPAAATTGERVSK